MTKRILAILATVALLLCAIPFVTVSAANTPTWKVGNVNSVTDEGYVHYEEWQDGYYLLKSNDVRGSIDTPNLDEGPWYMALGQQGRYPSGHWLQLTIDNTEIGANTFRNGAFRIAFPNPNTKTWNIQSKANNTVTTHTGINFMPNTAYIFKFAKENIDGTDVLAIYINGTRVFEGAAELALFSGSKVWFDTTCNVGANDTLRNNPLFINPDLGDFQEPETYFTTATKGGAPLNGNNLTYYCQDDLYVLYDSKGYAKTYMNCSYDSSGGGSMVGESAATEINNAYGMFEINLRPNLMYTSNWNVLGIYDTSKGILTPSQNGDMIRISTNSGGTSISYYYGTAAGQYITLMATKSISWNNDNKFRFELVEGDVAVVNVYHNDTLVATVNETDENVAGLFGILRASTLRVALTGHKGNATNNDIISLQAKALAPEIPACEHEYTYPCDAHCALCGELTNPDAAHNIVHVDAVAATCEANGNIEYWYCSDCGSAWADEALTMVTNRFNVVVPAAHTYDDNC
ncbi:MAG: hypothetical protein IJ518_07505, partial [Clostridia bacterium]|nr:hypothetical protein [Clostridia bacterium]